MQAQVKGLDFPCHWLLKAALLPPSRPLPRAHFERYAVRYSPKVLLLSERSVFICSSLYLGTIVYRAFTT